MSPDFIHEFCSQYKIEKYTINSDMSVDVGDSVNINEAKFKTIPIKFNKVSGGFYVNDKLISLEGCPDYVGANFCCASNNLTTLEGCPKYVGGGFNCVYNRLTTLQHLPVNFYVGGFLRCYNNYIKTAKEFSKLLFGYIGGVIETGFEQLDEFLNDNKNPPKKDLPRLLSELRKLKI